MKLLSTRYKNKKPQAGTIACCNAEPGLCFAQDLYTPKRHMRATIIISVVPAFKAHNPRCIQQSPTCSSSRYANPQTHTRSDIFPERLIEIPNSQLVSLPFRCQPL
jgi:hypothetical protein